MQNEFATTSSAQTKKLGEMLSEELQGGEIICLTGDLGTGKTTFTQGLLKGLKIKGPYTSPTFAIMKHYRPKTKKSKHESSKKLRIIDYGVRDIYHIDAYRISSKDLLDLGWRDFSGKPNSIVIIEWAERVERIIPTDSLWIKFEWINDKGRKIMLQN